ncbi:MAG TPA: hypothetical protein VFE79_13745 [Paraburkholderia sp.]|jgi:hypothetical protein|nr:hypothetical protein [Paraburkholderia sp.]
MAELELAARSESPVTHGTRRVIAGCPPPGLRVGVTGHRALRAQDAALLDATVGEILESIGTTMRMLAADPTLHRLYQQGEPVLRIISPLASGADRVVARQGIARRWLLSVPLPFSQQEYEKDFADSVDEFRDLLAQAKMIGEVVELDGRREAEGAAYFEAGHFVLRHSDLLIAVWDGHEASGEGGTGEIVEAAIRMGLPVIHINPAASHSVTLRFDEACGEDTRNLTTEELVRLIMVPAWQEKSDDPTSTRLHHRAVATYLRHEPESTEADDSGHSGARLKPGFLTRFGRVFPLMKHWLGGASPVSASESRPPASAGSLAASTYFAHFERADALATYYANVHRSAFVLIYFLGSLSLMAAFLAQFFRVPKWEELHLDVCFISIEFVALLLVPALVMAESRYRWRERWLDYRTLAEQFRQADLLATIGGSEPCGCMNLNSEFHPRHGWVPWFVSAVRRSVGIVGARYDAAYLSEIRDWAINQRLHDQLAYNEATVRRNAMVSKQLRRFSVWLFGLTLAVTFAELLLHLPVSWPGGVESVSSSGLAGLLAGIFPALGAASFGIRNQAEFEIVVHRSARLMGLLATEKANLERLTGNRLTSQALRRAVQRSATIMQDDSRAWAEIFEVKESEVV